VRRARVGGEAIYEAEPKSEKVLDPLVTAIMVNLMEDVINRGTAYRVRSEGFRSAAAGKTGTDDDGWFVGFTDKLVCLVWVGFDDNRDLKIEGGDSAAPIWAAFMNQANELADYRAARSFQRPDGLEESWVDVPSRIAEYQRAEEQRQAVLQLTAGSTVIEAAQTPDATPERVYEPIPHREQTELFLPGTKPKPQGGFFRSLKFWKRGA